MVCWISFLLHRCYICDYYGLCEWIAWGSLWRGGCSKRFIYMFPVVVLSLFLLFIIAFSTLSCFVGLCKGSVIIFRSTLSPSHTQKIEKYLTGPKKWDLESFIYLVYRVQATLVQHTLTKYLHFDLFYGWLHALMCWNIFQVLSKSWPMNFFLIFSVH